MMKVFIWPILLMLIISPSHAFVSKLVPFGGPINCEAFGAAMLAYTLGDNTTGVIGSARTAGQIGTMLENKFLVPLGQSWSIQDTDDNGRLVTHINGLSTLAEQVGYIAFVKMLCSAQENDTFTLTDVQFLNELGIPRP